MLLLSMLTLLSRASSLTAWPVVQLAILSLFAIGTALVSVLWFNEEGLIIFLLSPWVMPTITLVWVAILVVIHSHADGFFRGRKRLKWRTATVGDRATVSSFPRKPHLLEQKHSGYKAKRAQDAPGQSSASALRK